MIQAIAVKLKAIIFKLLKCLNLESEKFEILISNIVSNLCV
jgi:hypothetical protein